MSTLLPQETETENQFNVSLAAFPAQSEENYPFRVEGIVYEFKNIPIYDSPILIIDSSNVSLDMGD